MRWFGWFRRPPEEGWTIIPMDPEEQKVLDELRRRRKEKTK
jgi:hypothetical protein